MKVCILRAPHTDKSVIARVLKAIKAHHGEAWEADRDGLESAITKRLKDTNLVITGQRSGCLLGNLRRPIANPDRHESLPPMSTKVEIESASLKTDPGLAKATPAGARRAAAAKFPVVFALNKKPRTKHLTSARSG